MTIRTDSNLYQAVHAKTPRFTRTWHFALKTPKATVHYTETGEFGEVRDAVKASAKRAFPTVAEATLYVLP